MSSSSQPKGRRLAEDGTQENPPDETVDAGRSSYGASTNTAGEQQPGGVVPPYEGRKESADPLREGDSHLGGVSVGGAAGMVEDDQPKGKTVHGQTTTPGDEQPASEMPGTAPDEGSTDVGSHQAGVRRGEEQGSEAGRAHTGTQEGSGRPQGESTARDMTGVDPQEPVTTEPQRHKG